MSVKAETSSGANSNTAPQIPEPIGADGKVLTARAAATDGMEWDELCYPDWVFYSMATAEAL